VGRGYSKAFFNSDYSNSYQEGISLQRESAEEGSNEGLRKYSSF